MSMRWRLLIAFALIIVIALGTVAILARYTTQQEVQTFLGHGGQVGLENLTESLESFYAQNGSWEGVKEQGYRSGQGQGRTQGQRSGVNAQADEHTLVNAKGEVVYGPDAGNIGNQLSQEELVGSIPLISSGTVVGYLLPEGGGLDLPEDFETLLIERVNQASLLAALISAGIAILLAPIFAALILKPVHNLTRAVKSMAQGDLSQRVSVKGGGELANLGETFNQMAESLQQAESHRVALTADIAHELRNPLAIQRAHLEAMQDGVYPLTQESIALLTAQNRQLTRLVEDLRTLAMVETGELSLNKRRVDLVSMCQETVTRFEPQANSKDVRLLCEFGMNNLIVQADKERLQQIHDNLMQNALRYAPEGGWIALNIQRQGGNAVISFHNNGPQISDEGLAHLFERFYREDKARDRASGGTGLGLAIAQKLAQAHGGWLTGENHPQGGVVFRLYLPI